MNGDLCLISAEQAIGMLSDDERIHTFRSGPMALIGCDWDREDLIAAINEAERIDIGGEQCCLMNHGLVVWTGQEPLFVECRDGIDYEAEAAKAQQAAAESP